MKVHCPSPDHKDSTPSAYDYEDGIYCFVCNRKFRPDTTSKKTRKKVEPEDVFASITRIKSLPLQTIRGLQFHADSRGYYIVWPDNSYYKLRLSSVTTNADKYRNPTGHSQPVLNLGDGTGQTLLVIEGEINAMTAHHVTKGKLDTVSPGSAGNFEKLEEVLLSLCAPYTGIIVWTDKDPAGLSALIKFAAVCRIRFPDKKLLHYYQDVDLNDYLVDKGEESTLDLIKELVDKTYE